MKILEYFFSSKRQKFKAALQTLLTEIQIAIAIYKKKAGEASTEAVLMTALNIELLRQSARRLRMLLASKTFPIGNELHNACQCLAKQLEEQTNLQVDIRTPSEFVVSSCILQDISVDSEIPSQTEKTLNEIQEMLTQW